MAEDAKKSAGKTAEQKGEADNDQITKPSTKRPKFKRARLQLRILRIKIMPKSLILQSIALIPTQTSQIQKMTQIIVPTTKTLVRIVEMTPVSRQPIPMVSKSPIKISRFKSKCQLTEVLRPKTLTFKIPCVSRSRIANSRLFPPCKRVYTRISPVLPISRFARSSVVVARASSFVTS